MAPAIDRVLQLDPSKIMAQDNLRFGILQADVDALKSSIEEAGGVQVPVEVVVLDPAVNGFTHSLTTGFRRHQAVLELNKEKGVGLTLPAIVRPLDNELDRVNHQLIENIARKSMTPMDTAIALKKLMDLGRTRLQIREQFARPAGKNGQMEPASNAWLNMTLSFLDLPKAIQAKIHDGSVGVKAAYELTKVSPEKQADVLAKAEQAVIDEREREAKEEAKYLKAEADLAAQTKQMEETATKMDEAQAEVELATKKFDETVKEAGALYDKLQKAPKDGKKAAAEAHKAKETDVKAAEKALETARKALAKLTDENKKATDKAAEHRARLEAARAQGAKGREGKAGKVKAGVTDKDVKKAAAAAGEGGRVPLNAAEMRKTIADLSLPGTYPKVALIGQAIKECFDSVTTAGEMLDKLAVITGEFVPKPKGRGKK